MNQNMMMLVILGGNREKYEGKPEILPNDSSSDVKKKKINIFLCRKDIYKGKLLT